MSRNNLISALNCPIVGKDKDLILQHDINAKLI